MVRKVYLFYMKVNYECIEIKKNKVFFVYVLNIFVKKN